MAFSPTLQVGDEEVRRVQSEDCLLQIRLSSLSEILGLQEAGLAVVLVHGRMYAMYSLHM